MFSRNSITYLFLLIFITGFIGCDTAKTDSGTEVPIGNRKSPISIASVKEGNTYIKVVYGQPYRNGRTIFGELEPYGQVWRTGANEATEITITSPILLGTETVDAGTYSLFTIPEEDSWTIILNNELGQWGAFEYNESFDYLRIEVPVQKLDNPVEAFTITLEEPRNSITSLSLAWEFVRLDIPIRLFTTD